MPWQVINYTGFYVMVVSALTATVFGVRYLAAPDSAKWIALTVLAFMMTVLTLHFVRKLLSFTEGFEATEAFEGISAIAMLTLAFGLTAVGLWAAALIPEGIPLGAGPRAIGLMLCTTFSGYLLLMAIECISSERRMLKRR